MYEFIDRLTTIALPRRSNEEAKALLTEFGFPFRT
jgi:hypothetical protein